MERDLQRGRSLRVLMRSYAPPPNTKILPDDDGGNGRIRRIIDYLILIDGDLQAISEVHDLGRVTERRNVLR
jgi:hypothetical protein